MTPTEAFNAFLASLGQSNSAPSNTTNADTLGVVTGVVSDAQSTINAQLINDYLASKDCAVFDWRDDLIHVGETIRLGRNGNGLVGISAAPVFGPATSGARAFFTGTAGGYVLLACPTSNTEDLCSPSIVGVSVLGNDLADHGVGFQGCYLPRGDRLHVWGIKPVNGSFGFVFSHNPDHTGSAVNCCYGGTFGSLTAHVVGGANGFLFTGKANSSGTNTCFSTFQYCHATMVNGDAFYCQKGDDNNFMQIGVSRGAGGTGRGLVMAADPATTLHWVGNVIHNMNLSKTDGANLKITLHGTGIRGNRITYNGVDYRPDIELTGGAVMNANQFDFLGQSNYNNGWVAGGNPSMSVW